MPAKESHNRSQGCPLEFPLKSGGSVQVRNGLLFRGNEPIETADAAGWIRQHCRLTADQDYWLNYTLKAMSETWVAHARQLIRAVEAPRHGSKIKEAGE